MGFAYVQKYDTDQVNFIRWACDVFNCREVEDTPDDGQPVKHLKPVDWSGWLVTSMTDGDYAYIVCPKHTSLLHRMFNDGTDHGHNTQAVGF